MPELIDKRKTQTEIALIAKYLAKSDAQKAIIGRILFMIDHMPTIEQEVRNGRWIVHTTWHGMFGLIHSECSECKFDRNGDLSSWKYCPDCGSRMNADHIADNSKKVGGADNG